MTGKTRFSDLRKRAGRLTAAWVELHLMLFNGGWENEEDGLRFIIHGVFSEFGFC
jgi:hypothetical protein